MAAYKWCVPTRFFSGYSHWSAGSFREMKPQYHGGPDASKLINKSINKDHIVWKSVARKSEIPQSESPCLHWGISGFRAQGKVFFYTDQHWVMSCISEYQTQVKVFRADKVYSILTLKKFKPIIAHVILLSKYERQIITIFLRLPLPLWSPVYS